MAAHTKIPAKTAGVTRQAVMRDVVSVAYAATAQELEAQIAGERPDTILVDWVGEVPSLGELVASCAKLSKTRSIPLAFLTIKGQKTRHVCVISTKAGDGFIEASEWPEFLSHIYTALQAHTQLNAARFMRIGDVEIDRIGRTLTRNGHEKRLGPTLFRLLEYFIDHPRRPLSRQEVLDAVWGASKTVDGRTVDVYISRLRRALARGGRYDPIKTLRDFGWSFEPR